MADDGAVSFRQYLRTLRDRRGLSLQQVAELSARGTESLDKGTLSRLERGQQVPSVFKLGPLCRIYDVSADALIERMELDREAARRDTGRRTAGKSFDELMCAGSEALLHAAHKSDAYAAFCEALRLAPPERRVAAWSNLATAIRSLGKNHLALHEIRELECSGLLDPAQSAAIYERLSNCHR